MFVVEWSFQTYLDATQLDHIVLVVRHSGWDDDSTNSKASSVSRLDLFPSAALFAKTSSSNVYSEPSVSLSSDLGPIGIVL